MSTPPPLSSPSSAAPPPCCGRPIPPPRLSAEIPAAAAAAAMLGRLPPPNLRPLGAVILIICLQELFSILDNAIVHSFPLVHPVSYVLAEDENIHLTDMSSNGAPRPFIPLLAPSPLAPFINISTPKLSGRCTLNFSRVDALMTTTAVDCWNFFAPFLANVICCPQFEASLAILIGQSSKDTGLLSLGLAHANYCLSDVQQILGSQGANNDLQKICSIHPANLTEGSCPVNDVSGFENAVDSSKLLAACKKVDPVNECCSQICQNAIFEAARRIAFGDTNLSNASVSSILPGHSAKIDDCRNIVNRWLSSRLDPTSSQKVLRRISNCNINAACPLVFPDTEAVAKYCMNMIKNHTLCCNAMSNYVSHLQKQSFITNLQALDCAALLGLELQKLNVSTNVYSFCHITLKDFSLQVGSQESGCLLPSLPTDATLDPSSGISFTCDLNDNIAAPWPSMSEAPSSSCNKTLKLPALPAATSAQIADSGNLNLFLLLPVMFTVTMVL